MKGRVNVGFSLIWGPFHPDLERALLAELKANRAADPLAPLTVLVPNFQLVRHLRRKAAAECGALFNVRFETLALAVDRATGDLQLGWGTKFLPEALKPWVLRGLAERVGTPESPWRSAQENPGLYRSLASALDELRQGGFTIRSLEAVEPEGPARREGVAAREWAAWLREYSGWKSRHRFHDREDLLEAARSGGTIPEGPVFLYGFYDANALQKSFLERIASRPSDLWFVPYRERAAYEYARPFFEWAREKAARSAPAPTPRETRPDPLPRLVNGLFEDRPAPGGSDGPGLRILLTPGGAAEIEEAVRRVIPELESNPGARLSDVAFLFRFPDAYRRDARAALDDLGVPVEDRLLRPLLSTPPGKTALKLLETLETDFARGPLMDFLSCASLSPRGFGLGDADWNPATWDLLTKEIDHTRGAAALVDRLQARVRRARQEEDEGDEDRRRDAQSLLKAVRILADLAARTGSARRWEDSVGYLAEALGSFLSPSRERDEMLETLEGLAEMEGKGEPFLPGRLSSVARSLWEGMSVSPEPSPEGGVRLLDLMGSRGLSFDGVVVPGLVEGAFPPGPRPDPLLPDEARERLNASASSGGARLPLKARALDEERLLFALAADSARRFLILTAPVVDPVRGDDRNPSSYLYEVVEAVTGERHLSLDSARGIVQALPPALRARRDLEESLTARETLAAALRRAREGRGTAWARALALRTPFALEGDRLARERQFRRVFTPYDGVIDDPESLRILAQRGPLGGEVVSASRIETYAACPLRYFFRYGLGLSSVNEPEEALRADPLERGKLLHSILETVVGQGLREGWWEPPAGKRDEGRALAFLRECAERSFDDFEKGGLTGAPALWRADRARHLADLERLLMALMRDPEWVPLEVEKAFGMDGAEPVEFPLPGGGLKIRGRIDRVDLSPRDGLLRVVDYKTGRGGSDAKDQCLHGGRRLQLALYGWAARALYPGRRPVAGIYDFFTEEGGRRRVSFSTPDDESAAAAQAVLARILGVVSEGVSRGLFPAMAGDCDRCDFSALCGVEQEKRRDRKIGDPRVKDILSLEEIP